MLHNVPLNERRDEGSGHSEDLLVGLESGAVAILLRPPF
jgi:hypothetical protein